MRKFLITAVLFIACGLSQAYADTQAPRFDDFPASNLFKGKPAKAVIVSSKDREFAARLREISGRKINSAGHYTLASWGCGASCISTVAIDARTGHVVWLPFTVCCWALEVSEPIEFRRDSRLIVVHGSRNEAGGGTYYYQLTAAGFVLAKADEAGEPTAKQ
jgi:hypothetical protein